MRGSIRASPVAMENRLLPNAVEGSKPPITSAEGLADSKTKRRKLVFREDPLRTGGRTCPRCGSTNRNETAFCSACGADLQQAIESKKAPEDSEITGIIGDLASKLDIQNYPRSILWVPSFWMSRHGMTIERPKTPFVKQPPREIRIDPTYPVIVEDTLLISPILQGRGLNAQDLATLVAGPLINFRKLRWAHIRSGVPKFAAGLVCLILMFTGIGAIPSSSMYNLSFQLVGRLDSPP